MNNLNINLREAMKALEGNENLNAFAWAKRVESIDEAGTNGFALNGHFVNDADKEANQVAGIYVTHAKGRGWFRTYVIRLNEDGTVEELAFSKEAKFFIAIKEDLKAALTALEVVAEAETVLVEGAKIEVAQIVLKNESLSQVIEIEFEGETATVRAFNQGELHREVEISAQQAETQIRRWIAQGFEVQAQSDANDDVLALLAEMTGDATESERLLEKVQKTALWSLQHGGYKAGRKLVERVIEVAMITFASALIAKNTDAINAIFIEVGVSNHEMLEGMMNAKRNYMEVK